jgi:hypothetical protein
MVVPEVFGHHSSCLGVAIGHHYTEAGIPAKLAVNDGHTPEPHPTEPTTRRVCSGPEGEQTVGALCTTVTAPPIGRARHARRGRPRPFAPDHNRGRMGLRRRSLRVRIAGDCAKTLRAGVSATVCWPAGARGSRSRAAPTDDRDAASQRPRDPLASAICLCNGGRPSSGSRCSIRVDAPRRVDAAGLRRVLVLSRFSGYPDLGG